MAKKAKNCRKTIENDLKKQLEKNGTTGKFYYDLVEDYMDLWDIKNQLLADIAERGVVCEYNNGGGQTGKKENGSLAIMLKVSDRMTRILDKLGIKPTPTSAGTSEEEDEL